MSVRLEGKAALATDGTAGVGGDALNVWSTKAHACCLPTSPILRVAGR